MIGEPVKLLDEGALRALVPRVLARAWSGGARTVDAAEDALQEALLEALRVWPEHHPRDPRAWLATVATRRLVDARRSEAARPRRTASSFHRIGGDRTREHAQRYGEQPARPPSFINYRFAVSSTLASRIDTDRLSLQPLRPADAEDLFGIMCDPAIGAPMGELPPKSAAVMRKRIEEWMRGPGPGKDERWLNWLVRTQDGSPVAHLGATVQGSLAWLAWIVTVEQQRRGYATEAAHAIMGHLATSGVRTFAASIPEGHEASEGVARHLGLLATDQTVHGERVWRTQISSA